MVRERNKPTQSWVEKTKYELEHEEELSIERAYELGKIRGRKEAVEEACEWLFINIGLYVNEQGFVETFKLDEDFRKAMMEE